MNKKKIIYIVVIAIVLIFVLFKMFNQPKEFKVEDVMFDRSEDMMN